MKYTYKELLCSKQLFILFIKSLYPTVNINNEGIDGLRIGFAKYLEKLNLTELQRSNIMPKNFYDVIINKRHPFRNKGFPLGMVLHFSLFIEELQEEAAKN